MREGQKKRIFFESFNTSTGHGSDRQSAPAVDGRFDSPESGKDARAPSAPAGSIRGFIHSEAKDPSVRVQPQKKKNSSRERAYSAPGIGRFGNRQTQEERNNESRVNASANNRGPGTKDTSEDNIVVLQKAIQSQMDTLINILGAGDKTHNIHDATGNDSVRDARYIKSLKEKAEKNGPLDQTAINQIASKVVKARKKARCGGGGTGGSWLLDGCWNFKGYCPEVVRGQEEAKIRQIDTSHKVTKTIDNKSMFDKSVFGRVIDKTLWGHKEPASNNEGVSDPATSDTGSPNDAQEKKKKQRRLASEDLLRRLQNL